ncbi:MAG: enoyl-CoA hydratase [Nitrospirales bacterium]|nr:MAG: enoyl-CoA hydratase [Nitrospirales bacterium]
MKQFECISVEIAGGVANVIITRPEVRNAFNAQTVFELTSALEELRRDETLRAVVVAGEGPVFCAGLDLQWMTNILKMSDVQQLQAAEHLTQMFQVMDEYPCPVVGRVQGGAYGGGIGILAACDIVIATNDAQFALREVRVGLAPAVIAPLLIRKLGFSKSLRHCLTGEPFSVGTAQEIGLVDEIVPAVHLDLAVQEITHQLQLGAPQAVRQTKALFRNLINRPEHDGWRLCVQTNVRMARTKEANEGLKAFFEKRSPRWADGFSEVKAALS